MRLRWDALFGAIIFFAVFLFSPLLKAVGPGNATLIICVGLMGVTAVKIVEHVTESKQKKRDEDEDEDDDESDGSILDFA